MSLTLNQNEMKRTLNQIIQDASKIGKDANELRLAIGEFINDKNISGPGINEAKRHFRATYYSVALMIMDVCDHMMDSAEALRNCLSKPLELKRGTYVLAELEAKLRQLELQKARLERLMSMQPDIGGRNKYSLMSNNNLIKKYEKTIEAMPELAKPARGTVQSTDAMLDKLERAIANINTQCTIKYDAKGRVTGADFNNDVSGVDSGVVTGLETMYNDPEVMKAHFDPVNMATGCYIYNKSFLKTEGIMPLTFEVRYNSTDAKAHFGSKGWGHNHEINLKRTGDTVSICLRAERTEEYEEKNGKFVSTDGWTNRTLEKSTDGENAYVYTDESRIRYFFDSHGQCVKVTSREGFSLFYGYADGRLSTADTEFGTGYRFRYVKDLLKEVSDLAGRRISFGYEDGRLTSITDECGETYTYGYDEEGRMNKVINARGTVNLVNTYDMLGRVKEQRFPDDGRVQLRYLSSEKCISALDQKDRTSEYIHDEKARSIETRSRKGAEKSEYDDANNLISTKDRNGNVTKYEYDDSGNVTAEITALGDRYEAEYDEKCNRTRLSVNGEMLTSYEYDENSRLISETDALGRKTTNEYDGRGLLYAVTLEDGSAVQYEYDEKGNVTRLIDENGNAWQYSYDSLNRPVETIDANGNKESFEYNERSEITKTTNAAGDSRVYEYNESGKLTHCIDYDGNEEYAEYNELNKISKYTDKDGYETLFEYDKCWNLSKTIDAEGGISIYTYDADRNVMSATDANFNTTEYSRDGNGNVTRESYEDGSYIKYEYDTLNRRTAILFRDGTEEHFGYDTLGNMTRFTDSAGSDWISEYNMASELVKEIDPEGLETKYAYDQRGRLIRKQIEDLVTEYAYDKAGNLTKITNPDGTTDERSYDANGNMTGRVIGGVSYSFEYDCLDRLITVKREGERIKSFEYDKIGNRIALTDALGNTTRYVRSKNGNILTTIDALGHETHFTYDKCHRLIKIDRGEGRITAYTRDNAGNILTVTDALGNTESYEYDCHSNIIAKTDMDGNRTAIKRNIYGDISSIKYADSSEVEYSYDSLRRLKEVKDALGTTSIERDALGRETKITDHKGRSVSYSYDRLGNRAGITYPGGKQVDYEHDLMGRTTRILSDDLEASISYDRFGRKAERRCGDLITGYAYDKLGRLSSHTHKQNGEIIHNETYLYDAEDNIISNGSTDYEYDELNRLIRAAEKGGSVREYSYDAFGNRTSLTEGGSTVTYLYNEADQLLSSSNGLTYKYDKRGNVIEKALNGEIQNRYTYGANNRLKQAVNSKDETAFYSYNGLGFRVSRTASGKDTDYLTDQTRMYNNLLEADGEEYIWDGNNLIFRNAEAQIRDRLGSPTGMDEFGAGTPSSMGFTGYIYDDITGTYFAQAREYMPDAGRFAGRDILKGEVEIPRTLNEYVYCHSNPIGYVDYNGMYAVTADRRDLEDNVLQEAVGTGGSELTEYGVQRGTDKVSQKMEREIIGNYKKSIANKKRVAHNPNNKPLTRSNAETEIVRLNAERAGKLSKIAKGAERIPKAAGIGADIGINVGIGVIEDHFAGASRTKTLSNAGVNAGEAVVGILIETGITAALVAVGAASIAGPIGIIAAFMIMIVLDGVYGDSIREGINSLS